MTESIVCQIEVDESGDTVMASERRQRRSIGDRESREGERTGGSCQPRKAVAERSRGLHIDGKTSEPDDRVGRLVGPVGEQRLSVNDAAGFGVREPHKYKAMTSPRLTPRESRK